MLYFYFMAASGPGRVPAEVSGTALLTGSVTRQSVYNDLRAKLCTEIGCAPHQITVTGFSLEPNTMGA